MQLPWVEGGTSVDLEMREAATTDVEKIISFHNDAHKDNRKPEHWKWEYKGNYPDSFVFTVIKDAGQIIATQGMIPYYIYVRGKRLLTGKSENTLLNPKYRGGSLFQDLYEFAVSLCKTRGMQCIWGYTPATKALRRFRFHVYEYVMHGSISILNVRCALSEVLGEDTSAVKKVTKSLTFLSLWVYSAIIRATSQIPDTGLLVREKLADQHDLENLYERLKMKYPDLIHIDLDERYLRWRIFNHPFFKYRTHFVYEGDLLRAYAFVNTHNKRRAYLTDFTFETANAGKFLLKRILNQLQAEGIGAVSFWGNERNPLMKGPFDLLRRFGFVQRKTSAHFVLRNLSVGDQESLSDVTNWYMNGLWTEGHQM